MCKDLKFFLSCASVGWEALLEQRDLCVDLKQRCALRYQWMPSKSIRKHLRDMHSDQFLPHEQAIKSQAALWKQFITSPCQACDSAVVDRRQHAGNCLIHSCNSC